MLGRKHLVAAQEGEEDGECGRSKPLAVLAEHIASRPDRCIGHGQEAHGEEGRRAHEERRPSSADFQGTARRNEDVRGFGRDQSTKEIRCCSEAFDLQPTAALILGSGAKRSSAAQDERHERKSGREAGANGRSHPLTSSSRSDEDQGRKNKWNEFEREAKPRGDPREGEAPMYKRQDAERDHESHRGVEPIETQSAGRGERQRVG